MNFLKDYSKAEQAYLSAIKADPAGAGAYRDLASLYDNLYKKGEGAGEAILKKGVAASPDSVDLRVILARYYKDAGRTAEAKEQYQAAIAAANKAGQTEVAAQIQTEAVL
jgi:Tfp pilus assembly protein PilF